jgi:hypothetical protein
MATEVCDNIDNDCDGTVDDGVTTTYYKDGDGDSFGNPTMTIQACSQPSTYVSNADDCNDGNANINPNAQEVCDGVDNDCDGLIDGFDPSSIGAILWYQDNDGDGYGANPISACSAPGSGYVLIGGDCNDNNNQIHPGIVELNNPPLNTDGIDNNCNGVIDEKPPVAKCKGLVTNPLVVYVGTTPYYDHPSTNNDVYKVAATVFDNGSTTSGAASGLMYKVRRTSNNINLDWTNQAMCINDKTPNGSINSFDHGTNFRECLPVRHGNSSTTDMNKIRTYSLQVSDQFGTSTCSGYYKPLLGNPPSTTSPEEIEINEFIQTTSDELRVYPNPASQTLYIKMPLFDTESKIEIIDILGKIVMVKGELRISDLSLDISNLQSGMYHIKMKNEQYESTIQWVKVE